MAVYPKLSIQYGGGIISAMQQAKQVQNTASILIGLGGTGIDCIKTIKAAVRERLQPDDPEAAVPRYSHIQFLGVDTDKKSFKKRRAAHLTGHIAARDLEVLDNTEIFDISNAYIGQALNNPRAIEMRPELKWLNYKELDIPDLSPVTNPAGFRQISRYMLMDKSREFMEKVKEMILIAKSGLDSPDVNIHIFAGLGGVTGSGTFLDACYMVKSAAAKYGATVFGYFFLPDVNLSRISPENRLVRKYIPCNGYAAMQELDYCMRIDKNGGSFTQTYKGGKQIKWEEPPVTMCHLISATDVDGNAIPDAYSYAMNVASEYVLDFLTEPEEVNSFGRRPELAECKAQCAAVAQCLHVGVCPDYFVIGGACASIPFREINTYLASKVFGLFEEIRLKKPAERDIWRFVGETGIGDYGLLLRELSEGAGDDYSFFPGTWMEVKHYGDKDLVIHYTNQTARKRDIIEKNARGLSDESNPYSLIGRVKWALVPYIRSIDYGPMYAYRMLEAANLLNIIDGLIMTNLNRWNQERFQDRYMEYEMARDDFRRRPNKKTYEIYQWRIETLEKQKSALALYEYMDKLLKKFRSQAEEAADCYLILQRVAGNLLDTFKGNDDVLGTGKGIMTADDFAEPLITLEEVKPKLDQFLKTINPADMMDGLMGVFLDNTSEWIQEDENAIAKIVNDFFMNRAFPDFANRSITGFLEDKYDTNNNDVIAHRLYEEYLKGLAEKAKPLFAFNTAVWDDSQTGKKGSISVPAGASPVVEAAKKLHEVSPLFAVKESALKDRVYLMQIACALPLGSYKKCIDYENAYFSSLRAGMHYYEGIQEGFFNDWRCLPSLIPESCIDYDRIPQRLKAQLEEALDVYRTARNTGLLEEDTICRLGESGKEALTAAMGTADKALQAAEGGVPTVLQICTNALRLLQERIAGIQKEKTGFVLPHGSQADEVTIERIRRDFFVASPAIQEMMKEDIQFLQKAERKAEELEISMLCPPGTGKRIENFFHIQNFCHILFAGIFEVKPQQVTYHKEEDGIPTEIVLSKPEPEFPYGRVPLYQAFVSYKAMDEEERKELLEEADNLINNMDPQVFTALEDLKKRLNPQYNAAMAERAEEYAEAEEILSFLKKVYQELEDLCGMFGI